MDENQRERDELQKALQGEGKRPDRSLQITRRTFLHKSVMTGARGWPPTGGSRSWAPSISWWVSGTTGVGVQIRLISDNHLYPKDRQHPLRDKAVRAVK